MYQLEEKSYFYYLFAVAALLVAYLLLAGWKRYQQKKFAEAKLLEKLSPEASTFKSVLKTIMVALALTLLVIALVNPKMGTKLKTIKREGVDIVFALDVSKSMLAEDIVPNRLEKAKQIISKIIDKLGSDRVGIIVYAGSAYPLLPITTDQAAAKMFLQNANPDMVSSQGTAINEALKLAMTFYDDDEQTNRYLFVVSDGEDHEENQKFVSDAATNEGIKIFSIGVGKPEGGPIPIKENGTLVEYKKDNKGEVVITKLNGQTLQKIASDGGGEYLLGNDTKSTVDYINDLLLAADKKEFETKQFSDFKDQFQWFLGFGILCLVFDALMFSKKTKWIQRLNLFNENKKE
ncbi:VWA domain-containing protein [Flavobacteriaceae bacterium F08102]|nr:VWA domain-containing protein [Flavobacteriaceae bacterium F08102]